MRDEALHAATVDEWLDKAGNGLSNDQLLGLFELAMGAIWARSITTLGDVTLTAIAHRVVYDVGEKYPAFAGLTVQRESGIQADKVREQVRTSPKPEVRRAVRFMVVQFLAVLGTVTAELLTPDLHAALLKVALPKVNL